MVKINNLTKISCRSKFLSGSSARRNRLSGGSSNHMRKRIVLLDACNVGYAHTGHTDFSVQGVRIALQHFKDLGHEAYAVLPKMRLKEHKSTDASLLNVLYREGRLITTPCKEFPRYSIAYDDCFLLEIATSFDCAMVTNDKLQKLMCDVPRWDETKKRRITFNWNGDRFVIPENSKNILEC